MRRPTVTRVGWHPLAERFGSRRGIVSARLLSRGCGLKCHTGFRIQLFLNVIITSDDGHFSSAFWSTPGLRSSKSSVEHQDRMDAQNGNSVGIKLRCVRSIDGLLTFTFVQQSSCHELANLAEYHTQWHHCSVLFCIAVSSSRHLQKPEANRPSLLFGWRT